MLVSPGGYLDHRNSGTYDRQQEPGGPGGTSVSRPDNSLETLIGDYLLCCQTEAKSPRTVRWYQQKLAYLESFPKDHGLTTQIDEIDPQAIRRSSTICKHR